MFEPLYNVWMVIHMIGVQCLLTASTHHIPDLVGWMGLAAFSCKINYVKIYKKEKKEGQGGIRAVAYLKNS